MKLKTRNLIVIIIVLFTVLIGANNVKAAEVTEDTLQQMIDVIPENMNIDLKESEFEKADAEIEKQVKAIWKEKGIDTTGIEVRCGASALYSKESFYMADVSLNVTGQGTRYKDISIKYNNTDKHNATDEQNIKKLKIESPRYFEVSLDFQNNENSNQMQIIENYYNKVVNDNSITIKATAGAGGSDGGLNSWTWESGTYIGIFKNDMLYDTRNMDQECTVPVITVPSNVTDSEIDNYVTNEIEKIFNKVKISKITKGAILTDCGLQHKWSKEIPNGYTIEHTDVEGHGEIVKSYIIVRREQPTQSPVTKTDKETNIKLESNTDVVPSDTVLDVKPIEKSNITVLEDTVNNFITYDITLKSNGVEIQPNGNVKIKIPVPTGFNTSKLIVYRIDGNNKIKYNVTVETIDGVKYATFETNHFSTYVLAETKTNESQVTTPPPATNKGEKDETPKTGTVEIIKYILPITLMSAVGIMLFRKKKETK